MKKLKKLFVLAAMAMAFGLFAVVAPDTSALVTTPDLDNYVGVVGDTVMVCGEAEYGDSDIVITFDGVLMVDETLSGSVDWCFSFEVPSIAAGVYAVVISEYGEAISNPTELVNFEVVPKITPSSLYGEDGDVITVTGTGFNGSDTITLTLDGNLMTTTPATVTTNSLGEFTLTFVVPSGTLIDDAALVASDTGGNAAMELFTIGEADDEIDDDEDSPETGDINVVFIATTSILAVAGITLAGIGLKRASAKR